MANLNSTNVGLNYKGIINLGTTINTPLSTTLQEITDGDGVSSPLSLATNRIGMAFPSLTGSSATNALNITQTWNTTGVPTAIQLNVTNTASGSGALLLDLQVGGVSQMSVSKFGEISCSNITATTGSITVSGILRWSARSIISSASNGVLMLSNNAQNDFTRLQFGGTTSAFPSIKRSATALQVRLADDSNYAGMESLYWRYGSGSPEGVVTAPIGAIYSRTDGGAGTSSYVKESGVGNTGWVAK